MIRRGPGKDLFSAWPMTFSVNPRSEFVESEDSAPLAVFGEQASKAVVNGRRSS
jgi:hypothetical protein